MEKLVVIDGNSILNRAFYGIMGSKMLQTADGTYTNAVYGFLSIMFKVLEDINPQYMVVAFDLKAPTKRHEMYKEYKATRKGMPDELASQLPIIKNVLDAMNIKVIEKEGYEADDILGTIAKYAEKEGLEATILTGDRDSFQLASDKIIIRIPRTKQGKTEIENFDKNKVVETYGVSPEELIEVKGLMGDPSDNIPGVPGVGEKTALNLIKEYSTIEKIYESLENGNSELKGKLKENIEANKELAYLSRELGTIDINVPIEDNLEDFKIIEWDKSKVLEIFKELRFNRYIERFDLENISKTEEKDVKNLFDYEEVDGQNINNIIQKVKDSKKLFYFFETAHKEDIDKACNTYQNNIQLTSSNSGVIKKEIKYINIYIEKENKVYNMKFDSRIFKEIFEDKQISKYGYNMKIDYILLKQEDITMQNLEFDLKIGAYLLNSTSNAYSIEELSKQYLNIDIDEYCRDDKESKIEQTSLFDVNDGISEEKNNYKFAIYVYIIGKLEAIIINELEKIDSLKLFREIEMPTTEVLADMQYQGVYVDKEEIISFGKTLKGHIEELKEEIYRLSGEEFNINSTKQLGEILFEKLKLTASKKTKSGYSTDVEALEKITEEHPIVEKILEYRQIVKLNSTYVEGMIPYINEKTRRIHTYFHQTVTATGRISSTDPNLQNIPTRTELGKELRKVFKAEGNNVFIDADYSQIELRVLAHMSNDEIMVKAFNENADIHTITASQIFKVPVEEVSKQLRNRAKAVNFGIVYGISDFGLAAQISIKRKEAKQYIDKYLETYHGINEYMNRIIETTKKDGYITTIFNRRRYIPEINSNNYLVRKFGDRAAMNTPIQGTAADIMKIAMIKVYEKFKEKGLKSKIVLQIHDEVLIESTQEEKEEAIKILKDCMENVIKLNVPLKVDIEVGKSWYETK